MKIGQFLTLIVFILPFLSYIALCFFRYSTTFYNFCFKLFPALFIFNVYQLSKIFNQDFNQLSFLNSIRGISLEIYADRISIIFLYLMGFLWLSLSFYLSKFDHKNNQKNIDYANDFLVLLVAAMVMLIMSKNLFTVLFFYVILIIILYLIGNKFSENNQNKFLNIYLISNYFESFLIFLATLILFKINGQIDFQEKMILPSNYDEKYHTISYLLLFFGLFLSALFPIYTFINFANFKSFKILIFSMTTYVINSCFIYLKITNFIFGTKGISIIQDNIGLYWLEIIILINSLISLMFFMRQNDIKNKLFFLLINQFTLMLLSLAHHSSFKYSMALICVIAFIINFIILCITSANFTLFFTTSAKKDLQGMFYLMPISTTFFIFAILSLIGLMPSLTMVERFQLIKLLINKNNYFSLAIIVFNYAVILLSINKFIRSLFYRPKKSLISLIASDKKPNIQDSENSTNQGDDENLKKIAQEIDMNSSLIFPFIFLAILSLFALIFYSSLTQFL